MQYNPKIHHRRSIRLRGYDYSQAGLYFITICTQNRLHLFGEIMNDKMVLNDAGKMVKKIWSEIPNDFNNTKLHEHIIMPNHIHGVIEITTVGADSISARNADSISARNADSISARNADSISARNADERAERAKRAEMDSAPTIPNIVQSFKRHTTIKYIKMVKQHILPPFNKRIWQRNYWEHIIRNENECRRIVQYIIDNPAKWGNDKLNGGIGNQVMESPAIYNEEPWMI